jgi:hypothetical protein
MDPIGTQANVGDVVDVYGWIDNYTPSSDAGLQPTQHELSLTTKYGTGMIVKANMNTPIVPTVITDGTQFALNTGAGFTNNEDMLVTIKPAAAAAITMPNNFGEFLYSSASIGGFYRFTYSKANDGGTFPVTGDTFTSITGVATPAFGGHIAPRGQADFIR